jgi:hypothetical protein
VETANKNINTKRPLLKKLIDGLESGSQYQHLRIILSSNDNRTSGQKFLMVSPSAFGVVKLLEFNVENNHVFFVLQDILTGIIEKVSINVDDDTFRFLLISFDDIITLTHQINDDVGTEETLLDFDC